MTPPTSYSLVESPPNLMENLQLEERWGLRRVVILEQELFREGGSSLEAPIKQVAVGAVVKNPWIDKGVESELQLSARHIAARLAMVLSTRILEATGGAKHIAAFGKGAIVGEAGELEHAAALTHSPYFASHLRKFFEGEAVISFADARAEAGDALIVPLCEKGTGVVRNFYQSIRFQVSDAPLPNEILVVAAVATGPRPFPRVGDRATDEPIDTSQMNGVFV